MMLTIENRILIERNLVLTIFYSDHLLNAHKLSEMLSDVLLDD